MKSWPLSIISSYCRVAAQRNVELVKQNVKEEKMVEVVLLCSQNGRAVGIEGPPPGRWADHHTVQSRLNFSIR